MMKAFGSCPPEYRIMAVWIFIFLTLLYMILFVAICYIGYYASVAWRRKHGELQDDTRGDTQG